MRLQIKIGVLAGVLALVALTGTAMADPTNTSAPEYKPVPPPPPPHAKAYGRYCQGKSKKHVKGEKGTEFSRCVKAAAQLRKDQHEETA